MGRAWQSEDGRCAQIVTGDFCCFAGDARAAGARELAAHMPADHPSDSLLMLPHEGGMGCLHRRCMGRVVPSGSGVTGWMRTRCEWTGCRSRFAPAGYRLAPLDGRLYRAARSQAWSRDFVSLFDDEEDFRARGLGVAALCGDELVAAASSYFIYDGGIEIQVQTRNDHQRRGLCTLLQRRADGAVPAPWPGAALGCGQ